MRKHGMTIAIAVATLAVMVLVSLLMPSAPRDVTAAPVAAPTPLSVSQSSELPTLTTLFDGVAITSDTRACATSRYFDKADIHYILDQGQTTINTTTLTLEFSNNRTSWPDGVNIVASNAADAEDLNQFNVFGEQTCVLVNVTNSDPITTTVIVLMK